jgi:hypothetical protein
MGTEKKNTLVRIKYFRNKTFLSYVTLVHWFLFCHFQVIPAEASEVRTANYGDGAGAAAPTPASPPPQKKKKKKGKSGKTIFLSQALNFMRRVADDCDTSGEYVAMEIRSLSADMYRRMLKREICQSIGRTLNLMT